MKGVLHRLLTRSLAAALAAPAAAAAAPGDPYVVYTANSYADGAVILRTNPAGGPPVEISRNGTQGNLFHAPYDLAVEADGDLIVADMGSLCTRDQARCADDGRIIRVDPVSGRQSLVAGGPPLVDPAGLAIAPNGDIYVADNHEADDSGAVIRIDPVSGTKTLVSEGRLLDLPFGILVDRDGSLVVSNRVLPGRCQATVAGRIVRVGLDGSQALVSADGLLSYPLGVALDGAGRIVSANECGPDGLLRLLSQTAQVRLTANAANDVLVTPERLALDPAGDFLVSDWSLGDGDGGIVKVDSGTGGQTLVREGSLFNHPMGIAVVPNRPPTAALRPIPPLVAAGTPVILDASTSRDPEGLRLLYEWDMGGDRGFELGTGALSTARRSWRRAGRMTVRVRVNDRHGGRAVAVGGVTVDGSAPRITRLRLGARVLGGSRRFPGAAPARRRRATPTATKLRFRLSEPAAARVTLERLRFGRKANAGAPCRPRRARGERCLLRAQARVLRRAGRAGVNSVRIRGRGLPAGAYRVLVDATDAVGHEAAQRKLALRVVAAL